MKLLLSSKASIRVPNVRCAAGHARTEVSAGCAEDHDRASGHVFAAVFSDALNDSRRTRIANGKAFPGTSGSKRANGLPRCAAHPKADVRLRQRLTATQHCQLARQTRSQATVFVPYRYL